jgi:predicted MFS family arabinose efflux permease
VVTRLGAALVAGAFVVMAIAPGELWLIALGAVVFDLGVQAAMIAHQSIVYSIEPAARSRLNAVFMTSLFVGMASGAGLGSFVLGRYGWVGVCVMSALAGVAALMVRLWPERPPAR